MYTCFCTSFSAAPLRIASLTLLLNVEWQSCKVTFPALRHGFPHLKTAWFFRWLHCLPTFGSEIALSARISAPSFAGSPRCAFTLTKKVAVPASILFCSIAGILFHSISMAAVKPDMIFASGAPTNVAFPPSPIHLLTALNNDWWSHIYSNGSSISSACHEALVKLLDLS